MGNQQAAFNYNSNYEDSNDSGYFDDDVFESNNASKKHSESESSTQGEEDTDKSEAVNSSPLETGRIPKSKSIEIVKKSNGAFSLNKVASKKKFYPGTYNSEALEEEEQDITQIWQASSQNLPNDLKVLSVI